MRLRYCDIVSFRVTLVLLVTLPVDIKYQTASSAVVTTSSGLGSTAKLSRLQGCEWHVIASASSARTNGAPAEPPRPLCRLPLRSTALLYHHTNTDITETTAHDLQLLAALVAIPNHPQGTPQQPQVKALPISNQNLAYCAPEPEYHYRCCTIYCSTVIQTSHTTALAGAVAYPLTRQMSPAYL